MTELGELRERLRLLEDKEEIRNLIQDYRRTLDDRDLRAFSELFAAAGTWTGRSGTATGPAGIYSMLAEALPDNPPLPAPFSDADAPRSSAERPRRQPGRRAWQPGRRAWQPGRRAWQPGGPTAASASLAR